MPEKQKLVDRLFGKKVSALETLAQIEQGTLLGKVIESLRTNPEAFVPLVFTRNTPWNTEMTACTEILVAPVTATTYPDKLNIFAVHCLPDTSQTPLPLIWESQARTYGPIDNKNLRCGDYIYDETTQAGKRRVRLLVYPSSELVLVEALKLKQAADNGWESNHYFELDFDLNRVLLAAHASNTKLGKLATKLHKPQVHAVNIPNPASFSSGL